MMELHMTSCIEFHRAFENTQDVGITLTDHGRCVHAAVSSFIHVCQKVRRGGPLKATAPSLYFIVCVTHRSRYNRVTLACGNASIRCGRKMPCFVPQFFK